MENPILEAFLSAVRSKIPNIDECMNDGCSEEEIAELEQTVGKQLPKSYVDLLRKFNGEKKLVLFMGGFVLMNIKKVLETV
ncbi:SMI1/KNR4 family protein [Spirosoma profusum]|nr:SMI1/KNR4 family protein [Spirosoma profusum]